jgi:thioredoxin 1
MTLKTLDPNPAWDPESYPDVIDTLSSLGDDVTVHIWGADWCGDCRSQLPDFAAALEAADVGSVEVYPVERENGEKVGPKLEEYDVERIPTIVVERDGEELARFVENEPMGAAVHLAEQLEDD